MACFSFFSSMLFSLYSGIQSVLEHVTAVGRLPLPVYTYNMRKSIYLQSGYKFVHFTRKLGLVGNGMWGVG